MTTTAATTTPATTPATSPPTSPATTPATTPAGPGGVGLPITTLVPPPGGSLSIPIQQLAAQAVVASQITASLPFDSLVYQHLTLEQIIDLIRRRLADLEASGVVSPAESAALGARFDAVRRNEHLARPRADRSMPPAPVTVAGILAAVPLPDPTLEFDLLGFFSDALHVLEGAAEGFLTGGIPGAIIGGVTAFAMLQQEEGFLTA